MMTAVVKRSMVITLIAGLMLVGSLAYIQVLLLPDMDQLRQTIDDRRASIIVSEQERSNLEALSKNIENIQSQQQSLDRHIWSFAAEEKFFDLWEPLGAAHDVLIAPPKVADVTPTDQPINRAVTVVVTGEMNDITAVLDAIQRLDPLVVINKVVVKNGLTGDSIATVDAQTLWQ